MLRPQTYNEVRNGQVIVCESCQRVLYFDPATGVAEERPSLTPSAGPAQDPCGQSLVLPGRICRGRRSFLCLSQCQRQCHPPGVRCADRQDGRGHRRFAGRFQRCFRRRHQIREFAFTPRWTSTARRMGVRTAHDRTRRAARRPEKSPQRSPEEPQPSHHPAAS